MKMLVGHWCSVPHKCVHGCSGPLQACGSAGKGVIRVLEHGVGGVWGVVLTETTMLVSWWAIRMRKLLFVQITCTCRCSVRFQCPHLIAT